MADVGKTQHHVSHNQNLVQKWSTLGVPSISILSRDRNLFRQASKTQGKQIRFLKRTMLEKKTNPLETRILWVGSPHGASKWGFCQTVQWQGDQEYFLNLLLLQKKKEGILGCCCPPPPRKKFFFFLTFWGVNGKHLYFNQN